MPFFYWGPGKTVMTDLPVCDTTEIGPFSNFTDRISYFRLGGR